MRFRDTYKIARSQLRRSSRRTTLTILAVTVSIGFMVILISLGAGLKEISLRRIATVSELSRMTVTSDVGRGNILTNQTIGRIQKIDGVRAVYPQILLSGKIEYNDPVGNKTVLEGGIVGLYAEDFSGRNFLRKIGSTFHAQPAEEVILSAAALKAFPGISAENLLGETIQLTADVPDFLSASSEGNSVTRDFRVIGFVETSDDSVQMYVPLPIAAVWTKGQYPAAVVEVTDPKMLTAGSGRIEGKGFSTPILTKPF